MRFQVAMLQKAICSPACKFFYGKLDRQGKAFKDGYAESSDLEITQSKNVPQIIQQFVFNSNNNQTYSSIQNILIKNSDIGSLDLIYQLNKLENLEIFSCNLSSIDSSRLPKKLRTINITNQIQANNNFNIYFSQHIGSLVINFNNFAMKNETESMQEPKSNETLIFILIGLVCTLSLALIIVSVLFCVWWKRSTNSISRQSSYYKSAPIIQDINYEALDDPVLYASIDKLCKNDKEHVMPNVNDLINSREPSSASMEDEITETSQTDNIELQ